MSNNTSYLDSLSLETMNSLIGSVLIMIGVSTINASLCTMILYIIYKAENFHSNSFILIRALIFNELFMSIFLLASFGVHLVMYLKNIPETISLELCFHLTFLHIFFAVNTAGFNFCIATDRMCAIFRPFYFLKLETKIYRLALNVMLFISFTACCGSLFDKFENNTLIYCSGKGAFGQFMRYGFRVGFFLLSSTTFSMYTTAIVLLKIKHVSPISPVYEPNSIEYHKLELNKKLTKVCMNSSVFNFMFGPLNVILNSFLQEFAPQMYLIVGQYLTILSVTMGTIFFLNLTLFVAEFRQELRKCFGFK